jgi:hypothetical protein
MCYAIPNAHRKVLQPKYRSTTKAESAGKLSRFALRDRHKPAQAQAPAPPVHTPRHRSFRLRTHRSRPTQGRAMPRPTLALTPTPTRACTVRHTANREHLAQARLSECRAEEFKAQAHRANSTFHLVLSLQRLDVCTPSISSTSNASNASPRLRLSFQVCECKSNEHQHGCVCLMAMSSTFGTLRPTRLCGILRLMVCFNSNIRTC